MVGILFSVPLGIAGDRVTFTVFRRIQFTVPGDWPVIASKSNADKTVFAFQIPNDADKGTSDSSNIVIVSDYLKNAKAEAAFANKASERNDGAQERKLLDGWGCSTFSAMQKATPYVVWDCYDTLGKCGVYVRIAWPHLPKNAPDYDKQMESVLSAFLMSVKPVDAKGK